MSSLNFLLLATLEVMDKFLTCHNGKDRDNEACSSREAVCKTLECKKKKKNTIQNICLLNSQIQMLIEKRGYFIHFENFCYRHHEAEQIDISCNSAC
jgi:hypothetical protein